MNVSLEQLQKQNQELRIALEKAQTTAHYALKDAGDFEHRGLFANCPSPSCVEVRTILGKELTNEHTA